MLEEVPRYVVERQVPEMSSAELVELHAALADATERLSAVSDPVACVRTIYVPSIARWIAVFVADGPESVHRVARIAQLSPGDVHDAIEVIGDGRA